MGIDFLFLAEVNHDIVLAIQGSYNILPSNRLQEGWVLKNFSEVGDDCLMVNITILLFIMDYSYHFFKEYPQWSMVMLTV